MPDHASIDAVFRLVDREVWIVTAADGPRRGGLAATWVAQASIDPGLPIVAVAIAANHFTRELIDGGGNFGLHLVSAAQVDLVWRFAIGSGRDRDKLEGLATSRGAGGAPLLEGCLARLDCRTFARHDTGDRIYYWADAVAGELRGSGPPLREQQLFELADDAQRAQLRAGMLADIAVQRPLYEAWRQTCDAG